MSALFNTVADAIIPCSFMRTLSLNYNFLHEIADLPTLRLRTFFDIENGEMRLDKIT